MQLWRGRTHCKQLLQGYLRSTSPSIFSTGSDTDAGKEPRSLLMNASDETGKAEKGPQLIQAMYPLIALFMIRFGAIMSQPIEGLVGYGDFQHFYDLAQFAVDGGGGLPFIQHWIEFPPVFPYINLILYKIAGGRFHSYVYLLAIINAGFDLGNLWLFSRLAGPRLTPDATHRSVWLYASFLALPAFGYWTFEPMAVFFMLASLSLILENKAELAGLAAALGALMKLLPILALLPAVRFRPTSAWVRAVTIALAVIALVIVPLLVLSPEFAAVSFGSQFAKSSFSTVWALLDGNLRTGNFGPIEQYADPSKALDPRGQPARIPVWLTTSIAAFLGLWAFLKTDARERKRLFPFLGLAWVVLLLWMRGWSPQWLAYLVPIILLSLPPKRAIVFTLNLVILALLEWPLLLSRGFFHLQWAPVLLRTTVLIILAVEFASRSMGAETSSIRSEV